MDNAAVRPVDGPAPTVAISRDGNALWTLHTNRDQREDGSRQTRETSAPAPALTGKSGGQWVVERPATTVQGDPRVGRPGHKDREGGEGQFDQQAVRVTVQEAAVLQSFPADYPWTGTKTAQFLQVGNAVPPRLAAHVLAAAMGRETPEIRPVERPAVPGPTKENETNEEAVIDTKGDSYSAFLARKTQWDNASGFEPLWMPDFLYPFQTHLVDWAVRMGRCGLFADCGIGKTPMQLVWAENVRRRTGKPVLIVTPLAVGYQTVAEAAKFGVEAAISRDGAVTAGITVTNYERLEKFDTNDYGGVVCDESSAIKAFDGKRRAIVTEFLRTHRYRLLGTATAAPNDYTELGTSSEALGYLGLMDMLGKFFINKQKTADVQGRWRAVPGRKTTGGAVFHEREALGWRFKGHAEEGYWRWVASWARAMRTPSDLGFDDNGFILPALEHRQHVVKPAAVDEALLDTLFEVPAYGLREEKEELRRTFAERCEMAAKVLVDADCAVAWCHLNDEGKRLTKEIDGAVEVTGSMPTDQKEEILHAFGGGEIRVLVTKPSIAGWGLNWQHANRMTFFPSHSYEQYYQAVRRMWRFGQPRPVTVDVITTPGGAHALANLQRKADNADRMYSQLVAHMRDAAGVRRTDTYDTEIEVPSWL